MGQRLALHRKVVGRLPGPGQPRGQRPAGAVLFHGNDPWREWTDTDLYVDRYDRSGVPRLRQKRQSDYSAVFAENVFRLPYEIHIVPSIRLEKERVAVDETVRPPFLTRPLINESDTRTVPLLGL